MSRNKYYITFAYYFFVEMCVPVLIGILLNIHNTSGQNGIFHIVFILVILMILSHLIVSKFPLAYVYFLVPAGLILMLVFGSYWLTALVLTGFAVWTLEQLHDNINNHHNEPMLGIMLVLMIIMSMVRTPVMIEESLLLNGLAIGMFILYFLGKAVVLISGSGYELKYMLINFAVISLTLLIGAALFSSIYKYAVYGVQLVFITLLNGFIFLLRPFFSFLETIEFNTPEMPQEEMEINETGDAVNETFEGESVISTVPVMTILITVLVIAVAIFIVLYFKNRSKLVKEQRSVNVYQTKAHSAEAENSVQQTVTAPDSKVRKEYFNFEKWLAKRKLGRFHGETIEEWGLRLNIKDWKMIEQYKSYRYDSKEMSHEEFIEFKNMIQNLKKEISDIES